MKTYLYTIIILLITSCIKLPGDRRLTFKNNSNKDVYLTIGENYPDSSISIYNAGLDPASSKFVAKEERGYALVSNNWESIFNNSSQQKVYFFVIDASIIESVRWDTIKAKYLILKRYELTIDSLKNKDWQLTYP